MPIGSIGPNAIALQGIGAVSDTQQTARTTATTLAPAPTSAGRGAMEGRQVGIGNGQQKEEGLGALAAIRTGGVRLGQALLAAITLPVLITGAAVMGLAYGAMKLGELATGKTSADRTAGREVVAEQRFVQANQDMINALKTPQGRSLGTSEAVIDRLMQHAQATGKNMSRQEITDLVVSGENIAKALQDPANDGKKSPITVNVGGSPHEVASNTFTARATAWYMMASAASQDAQRHTAGDTSTSDMATSGSYVMKDPGNRMFNFLSAAPTAGERMSTHFEERLGHSNEHYVAGFFPLFGTKPQQHGIEDFQSRMPGQGGTMLFDKLKPGQDGTPELFVKIESAGCPPYFSSDSHHNIGDKFQRFFAALDRNIHHCINFSASQKDHGSGGEGISVLRQEHVKKGVLKGTVFEPVKDLAKAAVKAGIMDKDASSGASKSMKKMGMPAALQMVDLIERKANEKGDTLLATQAASLRSSIQAEMDRLGLASDRHGITRRGAEAHISIEPDKVIF